MTKTDYSNFALLVRQVIVVPIVVTVALSGVLLVEALYLHRSMERATSAGQAIEGSQALREVIVARDSARASYVASGDERFLRQLKEDEIRFTKDLQSLTELAGNNAEQQRMLAQIASNYQEAESQPSPQRTGDNSGNALQEEIARFQTWEEASRADAVHAAHERWLLLLASGFLLGPGSGIFLALFTRLHVNKLGTRLLQAQEQWTATLGSIGEAVIATDSEGRVTFLNAIAAHLTGWEMEEARNLPIGQVLKLVNETTGQTADNEVLRVLRDKQILSVANHVDLVTRDGREIAVEHSAGPILAAKGVVIGVVLIFRDVSERRREQRATAEQAALLELTQDAVFVIDMQGAVQFWSHGAETMLGFTKAEAAGTIAHDLLQTQLPQPFQEITATLMRVGHWEGDLVKRAQDGRRVVVAGRWALQWGQRGAPPRILIISSDITDRKRAEELLMLQREQLRALAERLQVIREEDRKLVARELHDQIGQILTSIKMDMTWITRHLPKSEVAVLARIMESIEGIDEGVRSVRKICSGLRPGVLDDLGLAAAVEWQASEFSARNDIVCRVSVPPVDLHLDGDRATAAFRIFQECLTNVTRHAKAALVTIDLRQEEDYILLAVEDDGVGFCEPDLSNTLDSLGLLGMRERAQFCGGDVHIFSSPGNGTKVTVRVPLDTPRTKGGE